MQTVIVIAMPPQWSSKFALLAVVAVSPLALAACGGGGDQVSAPSTSAGGDCPGTPVNVVVSVDQWGGIVSQLGGACAQVHTVLASSSVDPHDYEPSPADAATFEGAQLVVINGGHYDEWAAKLASTSAPDAPVISAIDTVAGDAESHDHGDEAPGHGGDVNPHVWYNPTAVTDVADAVTAKLSELSPDAKEYFTARRSDLTTQLAPYDSLIAEIKAASTGKGYAATESVFDDMAAALGLQNRTPPGYQAASSNETDPSPADLDAFLKLLGAKGVDVLIFNTQTEGSVPDQLRSAAEAAGVPVVNVTETVAPGAETFEAWQVDQLTSLAKALGVSA